MFYKYKCNICGNIDILRKDHYDNGVGCNVCSGKKVIVGINNLARASPEIAKYLLNKDDGDKYTTMSSKKVDWKCDVCGHIVEQRRIVDVVKRGFCCPLCSDGISYPNKVMANLLYILDIDFETEKSFEWSDRKRYDFYIKPDIIIEMHGEQHYDENHKWNNHNDNIKRLLARKNNILHYIEIDARESNITHIKHSIIDSEFCKLFDINDINWEDINLLAFKNYSVEILDMWNSGITLASTISKRLKLHVSTVSKYLMYFSILGKCDYLSRFRTYNGRLVYVGELSRIQELNKKRIVCMTTNKEFESINDAALYYSISPKALSNCLVGRTQSSGKHPETKEKLYWKYKS